MTIGVTKYVTRRGSVCFSRLRVIDNALMINVD